MKPAIKLIYNFQGKTAAAALVSLFFIFVATSSANAGEICSDKIESGDLKGTVFSDCSEGKKPALIIWGGSEGGDQFANAIAPVLAEKGLVAIALPYWNLEGLPPALERIDLGYFDAAIAYAASLPGVDTGSISILGYSRGSEAALLVAQNNDTIAGVVGVVPSDHVGANIDFRDFWDLQAPWMRNGESLPYATTRENKPGANWQEMIAKMERPSPDSARQDYAAVRALSEFKNAEIDVSQIASPLLLLSVRDDDVWASFEQSEAIVAARRGRPELSTTHITFNDVGHDFLSGQLSADYVGYAAEAYLALAAIADFVKLGGNK